MRALTNKPRTEKKIEARFEGSYAEMVKLRRMAQTLRVKDLTEWALEEKELYTPEEVSPELAWNCGGVAIRGARGKEGLTQRQLAELTGIAQHHISEMENGKRPIGKETARRLADALNIDYRVFL
ncbi:helix-turn-helix domain-containing protein [Geomonas azotofigens]|uniref:helix-turn-helix domain-containing protein n=1 Tax=Geomonas azotofigens TaxID=2843196 RepID=UPI001C0FE86B|nr:helix-turn-helix transcriptional regulator [Geomonas azotofigens]MBU5611685.1 helix-turn-helix domain-containing protein [Geomonas azotofigens]